MVHTFLLHFFLTTHCFVLFSSEIADFNHPETNKDVVFFLSIPKSGCNLITGSLAAITRKPISWFYWDSIMDPLSPYRNHISYNRLKLPLVTDVPLLYRTHYQFDELLKVPTECNKLILLARNPKELIWRKFSLASLDGEYPNGPFIEEFLSKYLQAFDIFESWHPNNRFLIFYEDFIQQDEEILVQILQFIEEPPLFLDDFLENKSMYYSQLLESYANQHQHNFGGSSSKNGPQAIYYTQNAPKVILEWIDYYIEKYAPTLWEKYLQRFKELL